jgi:hypothetical protein
MGAPRLAKNKNVVEEHEHEVVDEVMQNSIHERLECRRRIGEAEQHYQVLKMAVANVERRFLDVGVVHPDLVVAAPQIKLGE